MGQGKRGVERSMSENVCSQTLFLNFSVSSAIARCRARLNHSLCEHLFDLWCIVEQSPNLDADDQVLCLLPFTTLHSLAGFDNVIPGVFWGTHERRLVRLVEQPLERLACHPSLLVVRVKRSKQWDLGQHATSQVSRFEQLDVDVHVEGEESSFLHQLLFGRKLNIESLDGLSQQLLLARRAEHFRKDRLTLGDVSSSEGRKTKLHDGSVVQDLRGDVGLSDSVLKMRHEQQVTGLVVSAVSGVVVDVGKDSSGTEEGSVRSVDVNTEGVDQGAGVAVGTKGGDSGVHTGSGVVNSVLKVVNDCVGLYVSFVPSGISSTHLGVNVLKSSHNGTGNRIRRTLSLEQDLSLDNGRVQRQLLPQSRNVVGTLVVGIGVLKGFDELHVRSRRLLRLFDSPHCRGSQQVQQRFRQP